MTINKPAPVRAQRRTRRACDLSTQRLWFGTTRHHSAKNLTAQQAPPV